jgi:predicted small lipoprotein YifL
MSGVVSKAAAAGLVVGLALMLGACGRKSGLDLPPSASAAPVGVEENDPVARDAAAAQQDLNNAGNPSDRTRYAPKLPPKRIILDPILD